MNKAKETRVCVLLPEDLNIMIEKIQAKHQFDTGQRLSKPEIVKKTLETFVATMMGDKNGK